MSARFRIGKVYATRGVMHVVPLDEQIAGLLKHVLGDAGLMPPEDVEANERAIRGGERIVSKYATDNGTVFYIVTEWDRSSTTILLTSEM